MRIAFEDLDIVTQGRPCEWWGGSANMVAAVVMLCQGYRAKYFSYFKCIIAV